MKKVKTVNVIKELQKRELKFSEGLAGFGSTFSDCKYSIEKLFLYNVIYKFIERVEAKEITYLEDAKDYLSYDITISTKDINMDLLLDKNVTYEGKEYKVNNRNKWYFLLYVTLDYFLPSKIWYKDIVNKKIVSYGVIFESFIIDFSKKSIRCRITNYFTHHIKWEGMKHSSKAEAKEFTNNKWYTAICR